MADNDGKDGKPDAEGSAAPEPEAGDEEKAARQKALLERLVTGKDKGRVMSMPYGGALIRIDKDVYEPSRLTISTFSINPYDGHLIAGQMFQADILLPGEEEPFTVSVSGAIKTLDAEFGLRAIFSSPQPSTQRTFALHLMEARKNEPPPEAAKKKKGLFG